MYDETKAGVFIWMNLLKLLFNKINLWLTGKKIFLETLSQNM